MASEVVSVRLEPTVALWLRSYAQGRRTSRSAVVQAALEAFRDLAAGGVPDIEFPPVDARSLGPEWECEVCGGRTRLARCAGCGLARPSEAKGRVRAADRPSSPGSGPPVAPRPAAGGPLRQVTPGMAERQARLNRDKGMG
jgi:hypothetical protein